MRIKEGDWGNKSLKIESNLDWLKGIDKSHKNKW